MVNEIVPVQQAEAYRKPTNKAVKEAVKGVKSRYK